MEILIIFLWSAVVFLSSFLLLKRHYSYWTNIGLECLKPQYFFGNTRSVCEGVALGDIFTKIYNDMKAKGYKHGGCFFFFQPIYTPIDLDFVKNVLQNDFEHFPNHGIYHDEVAEPITAHLFSLENEKWRRLRKKLSPTFTSGKIKMMYPILLDCSARLKDILEHSANLKEVINIKDVLLKFTVEVISSAIFGLQCNALKEEDSEFVRVSKKIFNSVPLWERCKEVAILLFPKKFLRLIAFKFMHNDVEEFFFTMVQDTIKYRETNNIHRKDFMHLLLQLKNRGKVSDDSYITKQEGETLGEDFITINEMVAHCFVFFVAGFETSASLLSFSLLELGLNQDIQEKLREEINTALRKTNGKITYDAVMEMSYLDMVLHEALRKHPPGPLLPRVCNKAYTVPGTNVTIEKGTRVVIPALAIHNDPDIYPNPEKFDPERFSEENKARRHPSAFLAFGGGPRYCIGSRFGILEAKVALTVILSNFKVSIHQKTHLPIAYSYQNAFILEVKGGVWLEITKIK